MKRLQNGLILRAETGTWLWQSFAQSCNGVLAEWRDVIPAYTHVLAAFTTFWRIPIVAVIGFDYNAIFSLLENGVKLDDITLLYYSELGFDFPGNSLVTSTAMFEKNPDLVWRIATGVARAYTGAAKNGAAAISAVTKRDRLLNPATERQRMDWVIDHHIRTPSVLQQGLGYLVTDRMLKGIGVLKEGLQLSSAPTLDQIYDERFLPPIVDWKFV